MYPVTNLDGRTFLCVVIAGLDTEMRQSVSYSQFPIHLGSPANDDGRAVLFTVRRERPTFSFSRGAGKKRTFLLQNEQ